MVKRVSMVQKYELRQSRHEAAVGVLSGSPDARRHSDRGSADTCIQQLMRRKGWNGQSYLSDGLRDHVL